MRFPIPFCYEARILTASRNEVLRRFREVVEVEVPEFDAGALPVVLTWSGHHANGGGPEGRVDALHHAGGLFEVVTHKTWDGEGWNHVPVRAADAVEAVRAAMAKEAPEGRNRPGIHDVFVQPEIRKTFREDDPFSHKGPPKPATVIRDWDQEDARKRALGLADRFVVVDGILHRSIPEPVLIAEEKAVRIASEIGESRRSRVFRLDDADLARERTEILGAMAAGTAPVARFVLRRPDLLSADVESAALMDATRALLGTVRRGLATMPIPVMEAYCDLQEAFQPKRVDWDAPEPQVDPSELVRLGRDLAEAARPHIHDPRAADEALHGFERGAERGATVRAGLAR